jgi:phage head maturation protease
MREDGGYLLGEARVFRGARGDHLIDLLGEEQLGGVSVGFVAGRSVEAVDDDGPLVDRVRVARMPEWSLTDAPAYDGAAVLAVRSEQVDAARAAAAAFAADMRRAMRYGLF